LGGNKRGGGDTDLPHKRGGNPVMFYELSLEQTPPPFPLAAANKHGQLQAAKALKELGTKEKEPIPPNPLTGI
jgi:hypothetical protein